MRRTDVQPHAREVVSAYAEMSTPLAHFAQAEQMPSHRFDELADSYSPAWENAWIDLGGEG